VRIIHGKGRGSGEQPVLKQKANQWLRQKDEVLAFVTAPRWDGGTGAVYVLLSGKYRRQF
jgi:DNA-nicking Smr family endonuclease